MGSLFGSTTTPQPVQSVAGNQARDEFVNALYGTGIVNNPATGGYSFAGLPGYSGQLTPNLSQSVANNVWNSWSPQAPGTAQIGNTLQGIQSQINPSYQGNAYLSPLSGFMNQQPYMSQMLAGTNTPPTGKRGPI